MNESSRTFIFSGTLYALTLMLGIVVARLHSMLIGHTGINAPALALSRSRDFLITVVFITVLLLLFRVIHSRHVTFSLMLLGVLAIGTYYSVEAFRVISPGTFLISLGIVGVATIVPMVISHDLGIVFGIAGISALLGATMAPSVAILIMVVMAVYDFRSVARGKTVAYASHMLETGAVFGFIIPQYFPGFFQRRDEAVKSGTVMLLGSIDISLPLLLTSAVANEPLIVAVFIAVGALVGLLIAHVLLFRRRKDAYISGLPPIASTSIFGYITRGLMGL